MVKFININISGRLREWYTAQNKRNRLLLLLAGVLLLVQIARLGWGAFSGYAEDLDRRIEIREMEYANLSRMLAGGQEYERMVEQIEQFRERQIQERFVKAATPPLSEAMFQNIVNEFTDRHQVTVVSLRMLPRTDRDGVRLLRLGINGRAEIGAIRDFLVSVEHSPRMMFLEDVEIRQISPNEPRFFHFNAQLAAVSEP